LLLVLVALLAFANGANDNCKGVATLVGYGAAKPRQALFWAALTTALGAGFSYWTAGGLVKSFSTGLFVSGTALDAPFYAAVLFGAFSWVIFATLTGLPVSTTHAITGGLVGAGLVAFGSGRFEWGFLGAKFALPLATSPLLSLAAVYLASAPVIWLMKRAASRCACVTSELRAVPSGAMDAAVAGQRLALTVDDEANCTPERTIAKATAISAADGLHWASSGMVGFARGWNDAPKIAALALVALPGQSGMTMAFALVTIAMAVGGLLAGGKVLETLANKVTSLPLPESLTASLTTATLVSLASWNGMPVSTTHVSTGAIVGAGLRSDPRSVKWGKVSEIGLSWLITLPCAALLSAAAFALLRLR
jgi:PiT family inorganic phosphate transporter